MPSKIKLTPATIKELSKFVQVLDQHRFGAFMLIMVILVSGIAMALPRLSALAT